MDGLEKCPKCDRIAKKHGGMVDHEDEKMCANCMDKLTKSLLEKQFRKKKTSDFLKNNWKRF